MKDKQPDNYEGEKQVWQCIKDNLPEDILCYYNREVKGREIRFLPTYKRCWIHDNRS